MKFSLVIYTAPYSSETASSALRFARSLIEQKHELYRIFFFGDGVHNASSLTVVGQDEVNVQKQWNELIEQHDLDSIICVSSALRRGVLDKTEADRHNRRGVSAYESSEVAGLGQLIDAAIHSDRLINFG